MTEYLFPLEVEDRTDKLVHTLHVHDHVHRNSVDERIYYTVTVRFGEHRNDSLCRTVSSGRSSFKDSLMDNTKKEAIDRASQELPRIINQELCGKLTFNNCASGWYVNGHLVTEEQYNLYREGLYP